MRARTSIQRSRPCAMKALSERLPEGRLVVEQQAEVDDVVAVPDSDARLPGPATE